VEIKYAFGRGRKPAEVSFAIAESGKRADR